ncbi:hypothetical protein ABZU25_22690 [Micromonospora sp. NPDC005215]|uniref:hypothetical protein n=1 Tax=Micromonospora sp. NPDC005215 TaxID=3157024 RepID=UPI0033B5AC89
MRLDLPVDTEEVKPPALPTGWRRLLNWGLPAPNTRSERIDARLWLSSRWRRYGSRELSPISHWRTSEQGFLDGDLFGGPEDFNVGVSAEAVERRSLMPIGHENQGGCTWLFDSSDANPVVWIDQDECGLRPEHERMSETLMNAHHMALSTQLEAEHVEIVTAGLTPLPWEPWRWPNDSTRFFVAPGMIAEVTDSWHGRFSMSIGTVHRSVLRPLSGLGIRWMRFDG